MDVVGVGLGILALVASVPLLRSTALDYLAVRRLRRTGRIVHGVVAGVDLEPVHNADRKVAPIHRPAVTYRLEGTKYRTVAGNYRGAAPLDSGIELLVDPAHPYSAVAAGRHDALWSLAGATILWLIILAVTLWMFGAS